MSQTITVTPGTLPQGFCPSTLQETLNVFSQNQTVIIPDGATSGIVASQTKPADTTVTWVQLDSLGRPVRTYNFAQGAWLSLHTLVPGLVQLWTSALPDFTTFDGGDANPISAVSGPMWEEVTTMRHRFPLGPGTLPSGLVVAVGDTGGEEKHTLTTAEMPSHDHTLGQNTLFSGTAGTNVLAITGFNTVHTTATGGSDPHNNMPPYVGMYALRRTARLYYVVS